MSPEARPVCVILSCEHAGNEVPDAYAAHFEHAQDVLQTHRGHDIGSLGVGIRMASLLAAPLYVTTVTRLLVEVNRSLDHDILFSEFTRDLPDVTRAEIIERHYRPHRDSVCRGIETAIRSGYRVVHIGVHSFTDVLDDDVRAFDVGLLYDPARPGEAALCTAWREAIADAGWQARLNEPYLGTDDGLITWLRTVHDANVYLGVELEVRQGLIVDPAGQRDLGTAMATTLAQTFPPSLERF